jgi:hypothetical protein
MMKSCFQGVATLTLALTVYLGLSATSAFASLCVPDVPEFDAQLLAECGDSGGGMGESKSDSRPSAPASDEDNGREPTQLDLLEAIPTGSSSGSTTSSSGTSSSGAFTLAVAIAASPVPDSPDVAGWVRGEARLALPMPPGNELLRPPQFA